MAVVLVVYVLCRVKKIFSASLTFSAIFFYDLSCFHYVYRTDAVALYAAAAAAAVAAYGVSVTEWTRLVLVRIDT